jgi:hypothetical protein
MRNSKRIIILVLLFSLTVVPCFANMPVIDISAITTSITQFAQTVEQWKTTLKQYKSEFDRIEKAAKGLTSGDFMTMLSSFGDLTGQMASWNIAKTLGATNYDNLDKILENTSNSSYSLFNLIQANSSLYLKYYSLFQNKFEKLMENAFTEQMKENEEIGGSDEAGGGLGTAAATASSALETADAFATILKQTLLGGSTMLSEASEIYNNWADIVNVTPDEYAEMLSEIHEDTLSSMYSEVSSTSEMEDYLNELYTKQARASEDLMNYNSETEPELYEKQNQVLTNVNKEIEQAEQVLEWSRKMDEAILEVKGNQESYENSQTWKQKKAAQTQAELTMKELAETMDIEATGGKTWQELYDEYNIDNTVGTTHDIQDAKYYK